MRLATWNVNSLKVRLPQVLQWLAETPVDVLCLQELKMDHDAFPLAAIEEKLSETRKIASAHGEGIGRMDR